MEIEPCFQELNIIDKQDWNNIPQPLIRALKTMKKCVVSLVYKFKENNDKVQQVEKECLFKLNEFDGEVKSIRKTAIATEDVVKAAIQELSEKLDSSISSSQKTISTELESIKKLNDSKFSSFDNHFKLMNSSMKTFPKYDEVEKMIKSGIKENNGKFEIELKEDIKANYIDPEMRKVSDKFEQYEAYKEEVKQKFLEQTEERFKTIKSFSYEIDEKLTKIRKTSENLFEKIEKLQEDNDFTLNEIQGRLDNINKSITEKTRSLEASSDDTYERFLKFSQETNSKIENLSQSLLSFQQTVTEHLSQDPPEHKDDLKAARKPSVDIREHNEASLPRTPSIHEKAQVKAKRSKKPRAAQGQEDFSGAFAKLKEETLQNMKRFEELFSSSSAQLASSIERIVQDLRKEMNESVFEIREKLHWLPVNLAEIKGMNPSEARVFILEARLRAEENARNEQVNKLLSAIDLIRCELRCTSENSMYPQGLPSIIAGMTATSVVNTMDSKSNEFNLKEFSRKMVNSIRDVPTPERVKLPRNPRLFLSVDLNRGKRRLST